MSRLHILVMERIARAALEPSLDRFRQATSAPFRSSIAGVGQSGVFELLVYGPDFDGTQIIARATVDTSSGEVNTQYLGDVVRRLVRPEVYPAEVEAWVDQFIASVPSLDRIRLAGADGFEIVCTIKPDGLEYDWTSGSDVHSRALIAKLKALGVQRVA